MKNTTKLLGTAFIITVIVLSTTACTGGGWKRFDSAEELKAYLDEQPDNSPDKPIKVAINVKDQMLRKVNEAIDSAGKYVSLDLTGTPITTISQNAFYGCKPLVSITFPDGITEIRFLAFANTSLKNVTIPKSVTKIWDNAFLGCTSLKNVTIPESVTSIGAGAFQGCTSFTNITMPKNVTYYGAGIVFGCTSLTSITFRGNCPPLEQKNDPINLAFGTYDILNNSKTPRFVGIGDLNIKYRAGGPGTYITTAPMNYDSIWTKKK